MWMLLHGFTGSPRSWDPVLEQIDLDQMPLRPMLAGHGSDWRSRQVASFRSEVDRLASAASSLRRPRLIGGYSLGARVALGILVEHPGLFDGALLVSVHPGLECEAVRTERAEVDASRARVLRERGLRQFIAQWESEPLFETQRDLPDGVLQKQRAIRLDHVASGLAHSLDVLGLAVMPNYGEALLCSDVPVTIVAGARDQKFRDLTFSLADRSPELEAVIIEGAGHNPLLEAPQAVAEAMRALSERATPGASS